MGTAPTKKTIVHILSTNYAGSHYLSLMLGSHSHAMHLGEIHRIRAGKPDQLGCVCFACRDKEFCPIFSAIPEEQIDRVYDVIFSRIDPQITTLVDNSKIARGWAERFLSDDSYERKYVHLIRDPRALVRRWLLGPRSLKDAFSHRWRLIRESPRHAFHSAFASSHGVLTARWVRQNRRITDWINSNGLKVCVVTYRDLATNTAAELQRLTEWIGLPFEPAQTAYWNFEHHGTQKLEYEWVKQERKRHFDLRWQTDLAPEVRARIINSHAVREYLKALGLVAASDGLTLGRVAVKEPANQAQGSVE